MIRNKLHTAYSIAVTEASFLNLLRNEESVGPTLLDELNKIEGVFEIDYDGHFGAFIYLSVSKKDNTLKTWEQIRETIEGFGLVPVKRGEK